MTGFLADGDHPTGCRNRFRGNLHPHKRAGYYYLFASTGSCCSGMSSTYAVVVGRSEHLFGPYVDRQGEGMLTNHYEQVLTGSGSLRDRGTTPKS